MTATDELVLPRDVFVTPVTELSPEVRRQFDCEETDYAVSRPQARGGSKIVNAHGAQLLEQFRTPKTIVDAILDFSKARQADPEAVLDKAFPLLRDLCNARFLVPAGSEEARGIEPTYAAGAAVAGYEVVQCVQVLEDTEVYQVKDKGGRLGALKRSRRGAGRAMADVLRREAAVLRHLDGACSPAWYGEGVDDGEPYLLMEWFPGEPVWVAAEEIRRAGGGGAAAKLLALGGAVLEAYARLHAQGVVHADVHPRNVLADDRGTVKLVDFGMTRLEPAPPDLPAPPRAGIGFFFEPEYVRALSAGQPPPPASPLGEQYALGALLYLLFTGSHYLDFSVERDKLFRQITEDEPLPFARRGLAAWPEVESVLARALRKNPAEQFASVEDFARSLHAAGPSAQDRPLGNAAAPGAAARGPSPGEELLEAVLQRLGTSGTLLATGLPSAPTASVNYGAAGIAYLFYRVASLRGDPQLLATADLWANRARRESARPEAFYNPELELTEDVAGRISLYHTASGVHCVQALISQALGDLGSAWTAVHDFVSASKAPCDNLDLTLGRASTLIGCAALAEALPPDLLGDDNALADLGNEVLREIWSRLDTYGPLPECKDITYLGIAHGWAGFLYATLRWCQASGAMLPPALEERLQQLAGYAEPAGRGLCWPQRPRRSQGRSAPWPGWCHGSAGYVHLWTLAYQVYRDERFLRLAQGAAWHAWKQAGPGSSNLCCGLAGQAYALLNLHKCTGDRDWLERARQLGQRAVADAASPSLWKHSLYKGEIGIALLAADLAQPASSCMPLFEAEGWPGSPAA